MRRSVETTCTFAPLKTLCWKRSRLGGQGRSENAGTGSRGLGGEEAPAAAAEDAAGGREGEAAGTAGRAGGEAGEAESAAEPVAAPRQRVRTSRKLLGSHVDSLDTGSSVFMHPLPPEVLLRSP